MFSTKITKHDFADLYSELSAHFGEKTEKSVMFVGAHPRTGTSLVAAYFALVAAEQEKGKVLLADLGGPKNFQLQRILRYNGHAQGEWMGSDPLHKRGPWVQHGSAGIPAFGYHWFEHLNLAVSSCIGTNSQPTLDVAAQEEFWQELHRTFNLIVVDCPPRSAGADCMALAPHMDATVMVISAEDTRVPVAGHLRDELTEAGADLAGVVFNKRRFYIPEFLYDRMGA